MHFLRILYGCHRVRSWLSLVISITGPRDPFPWLRSGVTSPSWRSSSSRSSRVRHGGFWETLGTCSRRSCLRDWYDGLDVWHHGFDLLMRVSFFSRIVADCACRLLGIPPVSAAVVLLMHAEWSASSSLLKVVDGLDIGPAPAQKWSSTSVSYTHLTLPTKA